MSGKDGDELRRILVAFDAASPSKTLLKTAVELAAWLQAELRGLFVEDEDLLRSAELPFVRQFAMTKAGGGTFDTQTIERELKLLAGRARRTFEEAARQSKIRYSFDVVRGQLATELAAAAATADLVVLPGRPRPLLRHFRIAMPNRAFLLNLDRSVLLVEAEIGLPRTIFVAFDGTESSVKALQLAARLATASNGNLDVILLIGNKDDQVRLSAQAQTVLHGSVERFRIEAIPAGDLEALRERVHGSNAGLLVLGAASLFLSSFARDQIIEQLDGPILFVR